MFRAGSSRGDGAMHYGLDVPGKTSEELVAKWNVDLRPTDQVVF